MEEVTTVTTSPLTVSSVAIWVAADYGFLLHDVCCAPPVLTGWCRGVPRTDGLPEEGRYISPSVANGVYICPLAPRASEATLRTWLPQSREGGLALELNRKGNGRMLPLYTIRIMYFTHRYKRSRADTLVLRMMFGSEQPCTTCEGESHEHQSLLPKEVS